jgi:hypothetical protein
MGMIESPGKLDGKVEDAKKCRILSAVIKTTIENPIAETSIGDEFSKKARNTPYAPDKVAGNDVWMESEFDPGLGFLLITLFPVFRLKKLRFGTLNGKVHIPFTVIDSVDDSHSPFGVGNSFSNGFDLVDTENDIADVPETRIGGEGFGFRFGNRGGSFDNLLCLKIKGGVSEGRQHGGIFENKNIPTAFARCPFANQRIGKLI